MYRLGNADRRSGGIEDTMPEPTTAEKIVNEIPTFGKFQLPKDFDKKPESPAEPPQEVKPTEQAPVTEGADKEQAEPLTTTKESEKPEEKVSPRRFERRIDRVTKRAAEAEAKAEALARELNEWKSKQTPATDPLEPKMADFTDIEEYAKAKAEYKVTQDRKERETKLQAEQVEKSRQTLESSWAEKSIQGEDKYDDFAEIVGDLKPTTPWAIAIMEAENAADVAYYLGKHLKEAQRIIALPPVSQIREIAKLEARLLTQTETPKKPSQAPKPITPVTGASEVSDMEYKQGMKPEEYFKIGNKMFRGHA